MQRLEVTLETGERVRFPVGWRNFAAHELVEGGRALLDVGCGRGGLAAALRPRFRRVAGADAYGPWLDVAASRGVEPARVDLDRDDLPYADAEFDAVLCLEVIEHVVAPDRLVREIARVLEPGGRLYLSTPNIRHARHLVELVVRGRFPLTSSDTTSGWQGGHLHFFTARDLRQLLAGAPFERVDVRWLPLKRAGWRRFAPAEFVSAGLFAIATRSAAPLPPLLEQPREARCW